MRIILALLVLPFLAPSTQLVPVIEHTPPKFDELRDRIPSSGSAWVGFTAAEAVPSVDATKAFVRLPAGEGGMLCVEINSHDGRYLGQFRFPLSQRRPAAVQLRVPTEHQRELAAYSARDLVASAILARSCPSSAGLHVPVSWISPALTDSVVISVNSTRPVYVAWRSRGVDHLVNCQERVGGRSAAFNHLCTLSRASLGDSARLAVRRCRLGSCDEVWKAVALP